MTITEKILAAHAGEKHTSPGELVDARIDLALGNDITAPLAIQAFKEIRAKKVFSRTRIALVPDHFTPAKDILSAEQCKVLRVFARSIASPTTSRSARWESNTPCFRRRDWSSPETP
jgi:3-isopropylmalate/(R)-2-methylmalate dehydratase large subunit